MIKRILKKIISTALVISICVTSVQLPVLAMDQAETSLPVLNETATDDSIIEDVDGSDGVAEELSAEVLSDVLVDPDDANLKDELPGYYDDGDDDYYREPRVHARHSFTYEINGEGETKTPKSSYNMSYLDTATFSFYDDVEDNCDDVLENGCPGYLDGLRIKVLANGKLISVCDEDTLELELGSEYNPLKRCIDEGRWDGSYEEDESKLPINLYNATLSVQFCLYGEGVRNVVYREEGETWTEEEYYPIENPPVKTISVKVSCPVTSAEIATGAEMINNGNDHYQKISIPIDSSVKEYKLRTNVGAELTSLSYEIVEGGGEAIKPAGQFEDCSLGNKFTVYGKYLSEGYLKLKTGICSPSDINDEPDSIIFYGGAPDDIKEVGRIRVVRTLPSWVNSPIAYTLVSATDCGFVINAVEPKGIDVSPASSKDSVNEASNYWYAVKLTPKDKAPRDGYIFNDVWNYYNCADGNILKIDALLNSDSESLRIGDGYVSGFNVEVKFVLTSDLSKPCYDGEDRNIIAETTATSAKTIMTSESYHAEKLILKKGVTSLYAVGNVTSSIESDKDWNLSISTETVTCPPSEGSAKGVDKILKYGIYKIATVDFGKKTTYVTTNDWFIANKTELAGKGIYVYQNPLNSYDNSVYAKVNDDASAGKYVLKIESSHDPSVTATMPITVLDTVKSIDITAPECVYAPSGRQIQIRPKVVLKSQDGKEVRNTPLAWMLYINAGEEENKGYVYTIRNKKATVTNISQNSGIEAVNCADDIVRNNASTDIANLIKKCGITLSKDGVITIKNADSIADSSITLYALSGDLYYNGITKGIVAKCSEAADITFESEKIGIKAAAAKYGDYEDIKRVKVPADKYLDIEFCVYDAPLTNEMAEQIDEDKYTITPKIAAPTKIGPQTYTFSAVDGSKASVSVNYTYNSDNYEYDTIALYAGRNTSKDSMLTAAADLKYEGAYLRNGKPSSEIFTVCLANIYDEEEEQVCSLACDNEGVYEGSISLKNATIISKDSKNQKLSFYVTKSPAIITLSKKVLNDSGREVIKKTEWSILNDSCNINSAVPTIAQVTKAYNNYKYYKDDYIRFSLNKTIDGMITDGNVTGKIGVAPLTSELILNAIDSSNIKYSEVTDSRGKTKAYVDVYFAERKDVLEDVIPVIFEKTGNSKLYLDFFDEDSHPLTKASVVATVNVTAFRKSSTLTTSYNLVSGKKPAVEILSKNTGVKAYEFIGLYNQNTKGKFNRFRDYFELEESDSRWFISFKKNYDEDGNFESYGEVANGNYSGYVQYKVYYEDGSSSVFVTKITVKVSDK